MRVLVLLGELPVVQPEKPERGHQRLLRDFLVQADLVKFARHMPTAEATLASLQSVERFVEETREDPSAALREGPAAEGAGGPPAPGSGSLLPEGRVG